MENEVQKKDSKGIIIAVIVGFVLCFVGGIVFALVYGEMNNKNKKDNTTTVADTTTTTTAAVTNPDDGGDNKNQTATQELIKLSLNDAEGDLYAKTFYLSNKTLYAIPTSKSKITLKSDAKTIDGNKVYKVADNVEKAYTVNVGQSDFYQVLYITDGKLYRVAIYDDEKKSALSTYQLDYKNVKEVVACIFENSVGYIVINKDNQILADTIKNSDGTEETYIYYDQKGGRYINNVNGDILEVEKIKTDKDGEHVITTFEITYKSKKEKVEIDTSIASDDSVIHIQVEKQGDAYTAYGD